MTINKEENQTSDESNFDIFNPKGLTEDQKKAIVSEREAAQAEVKSVLSSAVNLAVSPVKPDAVDVQNYASFFDGILPNREEVPKRIDRTISNLDEMYRPSKKCVCTSCAAAIWIKVPSELKCFCQRLRTIVWTTHKPTPVLDCSGWSDEQNSEG